jgi:hypothetical protein
VRELTLRRRRELAIGYRRIGIRHLTRQEFRAHWNRESRFPDLMGAVDLSRDTWHRIPVDRSFGVRRSWRQGLNPFEIATGDFSNRPELLIGERTRGERSEGVRIRGFARSVTLCIRRCELPNREIPIERGGDRFPDVVLPGRC